VSECLPNTDLHACGKSDVSNYLQRMHASMHCGIFSTHTHTHISSRGISSSSIIVVLTLLSHSVQFRSVYFSSVQLVLLVLLYFLQLPADSSMASACKLSESGSEEKTFYYGVTSKNRKK
jgi:hypothetical protein